MAAPEAAAWTSRPVVSRVLRVGAVGLPLLVAFTAAQIAGALVSGGHGAGGLLVRIVVPIVASTVAVWITDRYARRLLPIATLYRLSLVFPDRAPSRFKMALKSGSSRRIQELAAETRRNGLPDDPGLAAERVVDLIATIGSHDRRTRGHSERVRLFAELIGEELHLTKEERQKLQWAALLHDAGKLTVPPEILNKRGKPTPEEWEVLSGHPLAGEALIEPLRPFLGEWVGAVGGHHEKWDGSGYPRRLAGRQIPRAAAIVAVADSYEVMTAVRSYKRAMPVAAARAELARCAGSHFSPDVVRAFLSVSIGHLRLVAGPLAGLAHLPFAQRVVDLPTELAGVAHAGTRVASALPALVVGGLASGAVLAAASAAAPAPIADRPLTRPPAPIAAPTATSVPVKAGPAGAGSPSAPATTTTTAAPGSVVHLTGAPPRPSVTTPPTGAVTVPTTTPPGLSPAGAPAVTGTTIGRSPTPTPVAVTPVAVTPTPTSTVPATTVPIAAPPVSVAPTTTTTAPPNPCALVRSNRSPQMPGAHLAGCDLSGATLDSADLDNADLTGANLRGAMISRSGLNGATLTGADLTGAHLEDVGFQGAHLSGAHLDGVHADNVGFKGADLSGATLTGSHLGSSNFDNAALTGANASQSHWVGVEVLSADLDRVVFDQTDLTGSRLDGSSMQGTSLAGTNLNNASLRSVTGTPIGYSTAEWHHTVCPNGTTSNRSCY